MRALQASITFIDKILILFLGFVAVFIPAFFIINRVLFDDVGMLWISTPMQEFVYPMDKEQSIKVQGRIGSIEIEVKNRKFRFEETKEVYDLISAWLTEAQKNNCKEITVRVI